MVLLLVRVNKLNIIAITTLFTVLSNEGVSLVRHDAVRSTVSTPGINKVIHLAHFVIQKAFLVRLVKVVIVLPAFYKGCNVGKV